MVELGEMSLLRESQGGKKGEIPALWGGLIWAGDALGVLQWPKMGKDWTRSNFPASRV